MGYFTDNIAKESVIPAKVSLSNLPNFIQFESLNDSAANQYVDISLKVLNTSLDLGKTQITIIENDTGLRHEYKGTRDKADVNSSTFYLSDDKAQTAENIRDCLLNEDFFRAKFYITIPPIYDGSVRNGDTIRIRSIRAGVDYAFHFEALDGDFIGLTGDPENTSNNDSISGGDEETEISMEVYKDTGVFLGADDTPQSYEGLGTFLIDLSKSYNNTPIWFDLNAVFGAEKSYSNDFLYSDNWTDAGTLTDYRIIAKKYNGVTRQTFYISNILYSVLGYDRNLEVNDLSLYVYDTKENNIVKPLTKQPALFHVKGQTQYFNFILSDPDRNITLSPEYNFGIAYRVYTQSRNFIAEVKAHSQNRKSFSILNTIKLDIDAAIEEYSNAGIIEIYLTRADSYISEPLTYHILPHCLFKVNDFAFLNSLGGWDAFNFSGTDSTDFKASANTIYRTQTPDFDISSEIESIHYKEVSEQFTAQTMPIKENVCNWLKELSASVAVYELSTKRFVIVDEMNIKPNSKDELFRVEMKYHYSDKFNALMV